jgi:16S rRNA processing protein RimM
VADLIGLTVKDADTGEVYGRLSDVLQTGGRDVYVIKGERELLFPAIPEVVVSVDIAGGEMLIRPLEGLFDI